MQEQRETRPGHSVGEYRLVRTLGGGSFGTVYLAEHMHEHTQVAVKLFHTPLTKNEDFKDFLSEARTIRLRHPHIVPLLDFSINHDDLPFLVMEYAPRGTLRDCHSKEERIPLSTVISYVDQLASALQYAHDQRVIHRDIKPANILVRADGTLMVSDFGIAKFLEQSLLTNREKLAGTPEYMAPEQHKGKTCFASDQYALAVVVYEWICGVRPFQGTILNLATQHMNTPPPPPRDHIPQLSEAVESIILKALAKAPEDRFEHIQEFADALRKAVQPLPSAVVVSSLIETEKTIPTPSPQKRERTSVQSNRRRLVFVLILLILALIGAGSLGVYNGIMGNGRVNTSRGQLTPGTQSRSNQVTATAPANTNAPGRVWTAQTSGSSQDLYSIVWSGSRFVAVGFNGTILTSPNGITWTPQTSSTSKPLHAIAQSGSQLIAVGDSGTILTSPNGITWTPQTSDISQELYGIASSGSLFVAVGSNGTILTSPDGITWTPQTSSTSKTLRAIARRGSLFIAVGDSGTILTSPNGITWTPQTSDTSANLHGIARSDSQIVAVGLRGTILTSPNGITWTPQTSDTSETLHGIARLGSLFVAVGEAGMILTSPDGITWTLRSSDTSANLWGVASSGSLFVAVGIGTILISP